jgi:hypothetical protein
MTMIKSVVVSMLSSCDSARIPRTIGQHRLKCNPLHLRGAATATCAAGVKRGGVCRAEDVRGRRRSSRQAPRQRRQSLTGGDGRMLGAHELFGINGANPTDHAGTEVFLDAVGRSRGRCAQEAGFELLAVGAVVDPFARGRDPLAGGIAPTITPTEARPIWDAQEQRRRAPIRFRPPQTAENRGCSAETGNSGLA